MKVILYMEVTANGMIAGEKDDTSWVSEEAWKSYMKISSEQDAIIIGKRTYDIMPSEEFQTNPLYIVLSHVSEKETKASNIKFFNGSIKEVIEFCKDQNFEKLMVAGGSQTVTQFMKNKFIHEIFLDLEPKFLGNGVHLFQQEEFNYDLELLELKKLNGNTIQLHYRVL